jgi:hypothetical protein
LGGLGYCDRDLLFLEGKTFMEMFQWYRKLQGGTWYYVRNTQLLPVGFYWVRKPIDFETVIKEENYETDI